jgi:hypothetical protein
VWELSTKHILAIPKAAVMAVYRSICCCHNSSAELCISVVAAPWTASLVQHLDICFARFSQARHKASTSRRQLSGGHRAVDIKWHVQYHQKGSPERARYAQKSSMKPGACFVVYGSPHTIHANSADSDDCTASFGSIHSRCRDVDGVWRLWLASCPVVTLR